MSAAFIELIRRIASEKFPPSSRGARGHEPFNVSDLCRAAFGAPEKTQWTRIAGKPENLRLDDAAALAQAVGASFAGLIADCRDPSLQTLVREQLLTRGQNQINANAKGCRKVNC